MKYLKSITVLTVILVAVFFLAKYTGSISNIQLNIQHVFASEPSKVIDSPVISERSEDIDNNNDISAEKKENNEQVIENKNDSQIIDNIGSQTIENNIPADNNFPSYLEIPSIGVNATIEHVGLTAEGNMDMTSSSKNVAWYELGTRPGEIGSATIGGHYGYPGPAVFRNLPNLKKGDIVYVKGNNGETIKFAVREIRTYRADDIVKEVFLSDDGIAHLNIVTCNGTWLPSLQTYDKRLVVFTDMVS